MDEPPANEDDILYLAPCRPAMIRGVPLQGWLACISGFMMPLIIWGAPAVIPAIFFSVGFYYLLRESFARDFNCVNILLAWCVTRAGVPGALTWGGASIDPLPRKPRWIDEARRNV